MSEPLPDVVMIRTHPGKLELRRRAGSASPIELRIVDGLPIGEGISVKLSLADLERLADWISDHLIELEAELPWEEE